MPDYIYSNEKRSVTSVDEEESAVARRLAALPLDNDSLREDARRVLTILLGAADITGLAVQVIG
jgi:hypothetical protein